MYLPTLLFSIGYYGAIGAAWAWVLANFISLFAWVPFAHRQLLPGFHVKWILLDITPIIASVFFTVWLSKHFLNLSDSRFWLGLEIGSVLAFSYFVAAISSSYFRGSFKRLFGTK
jgi:hypothetical protein